jgi:hypothetical protein
VTAAGRLRPCLGSHPWTPGRRRYSRGASWRGPFRCSGGSQFLKNEHTDQKTTTVFFFWKTKHDSDFVVLYLFSFFCLSFAYY